jgi:trk system potassium uptake protein
VLLGSITLWAAGALMFAALEWNNTMRDISWHDKAVCAIFQSVTTRTAGFNTLDFASMREPTLVLTILLMLIGAAPGGCAGGLKVTTIMVILATVRARLRDSKQVSLLERTIPAEIVSRTFYTVTLSLLFLAVVIAALLVTEERPLGTGVRIDQLTTVAFEASSAFGTVGLSTGMTASLSSLGKLLIIMTMFVGRLGPLAVALAVLRPRRQPQFEYPKEELAIG